MIDYRVFDPLKPNRKAYLRRQVRAENNCQEIIKTKLTPKGILRTLHTSPADQSVTWSTKRDDLPAFLPNRLQTLLLWQPGSA